MFPPGDPTSAALAGGMSPLMGGGGPTPDMAGLIPGMGGPAPAPDAGGGEPSPEDVLRTMLELATVYRTVETDHQDLLAMEKVSTLVQQILASNQSQQDSMLGPNARTIRRLAGG